MSEPNQIWDGSSISEDDGRYTWAELNEACAEEDGYCDWLERVLDPPLQLTWPAHLGGTQPIKTTPSPAVAFSFEWVRKHLGQG